MQACKRQTPAFSGSTHFAYPPQKQLAIPLDREPNTRRKPREWRFVFHPWVHANNNVRCRCHTFMLTNLIPAAAQPASDCGAQVNQWLHGLIEIAKVCVIFAGGYFSHWLLLRRDVSGRKRAFRAFM